MPIPPQTAAAPAISDQEFLKFREFFYRKTGIMFADSKRYFVDKRLLGRMADAKLQNFAEYFDRVRTQASGVELQALVNSMTINETYFYREDYQLECLVRSLMPEIAKSTAKGDRIRIWSIPCSTGEEPYSIALYLLEYWAEVDDFEIEIVASDIDTEVIEKARRGVYGERALQHVSADTIKKYMTRTDDGQHQIIDAIRSSIKFSQLNILETIDKRIYGEFDVIFCRNLLIYFDDLSRREAAEAIFAALRPGGFVCLGHSESMSRISSLFNLRKFPEAIVYQKPALS
ncbi:MAG: protein-glutamate O-methyltransferase CheR [Roseiarcus sp.]